MLIADQVLLHNRGIAIASACCCAALAFNPPPSWIMNLMIKTLPKLNHLIDVWCERRCLKPLCYILRDYPLCMEVTEEWKSILHSLKEIKGICSHELAVEERKILSELISTIQQAIPDE